MDKDQVHVNEDQAQINKDQDSTNISQNDQNTDLNQSITALVESGHQQSENIDRLSDSMSILVQSIRMRPTKKQTTGLVAGVTVVILLLNILMFGFIYTSSKDTRQLAAQVADCLKPDGVCYKQSQDLQQLNRRFISLRSEQLRLQDEIEIARAPGNQPVIEKRTELLHNIEQQLVGAGQLP